MFSKDREVETPVVLIVKALEPTSNEVETEAEELKRAKPEIEAVPPTSKVASMLLPALIPSLVDTEAMDPKDAVPLTSKSPEMRRSLDWEI